MSVEAQLNKYSVLLNPQAITNGQTASQYMDCSEAEYNTILCQVALGATGTIASAQGATVTLSTSDTTYASNFASVSSFTGIKVSNDNVFMTDVRKQKRYLQIAVAAGTAAGTNENATVSAVGFLSGISQTPSGTVAAPGLGGTYVTGANDNFVIN
jgi:uncharacterized membrane protein YfcA